MKFDIRKFGAAGDGRTDDTKAIQRAIDACPAGGTVLISGGTFVSGALFLKSGICLQIDTGSVLLGSRNLSRYPVIRYLYEGVEEKCYASLLNTSEGPNSNISITGGGAIDAGGLLLAALEMDTAYKRGRSVCIRGCRGVTISNVKILHSPQWNLHLIGCSDVNIHDVEIDSAYPQDPRLHAYPDNDDGIALESCENVEIRNAFIRTYDDCISIKSGRGPLARALARPTKNVRISHCSFHLGSGVAIGSEISGGAEDILISDCRFYDTFSMFCLKTTRLRGAFIRRITMRDCVMQDRDTGVYAYRRHKGIIYIDSEYKDKNPAEAPPESLTRVSDIFLSNLQIDAPEVETTLYIKGFEEQPFENIVLEDIRSNCRGSDFIQNAEVHGAVRCNESLGTFQF